VLGTLRTSSSAELAKVLTVLVGAVGWRTRCDGEIAYEGKSVVQRASAREGKEEVVLTRANRCKSVQVIIRRQGAEKDRIGGVYTSRGHFTR
jgi:hypothetical protein